IVAARAMERMPERRGGNQSARTVHFAPKSREVVARAFKVGVNSVQQAKALLAEAPDLADQVADCTLSLAGAMEALQGRRKDTAKKAKDAKRVEKYRQAISAGELTFEEALKKAVAEERAERERQEVEADARRGWLEKLEEVVAWIETHIGKVGDDYLA